VGVSGIDEQHKYFISLLNEAESLAKGKVSGDEAERVVRSLEAYARKHFDTEEKMLESIKYPKLKEHRFAHLELIEKTAIFYDRILLGGIDIKKVADFMEAWFKTHLMTHDHEYAEYIKKYGTVPRKSFFWFLK